MEREKTAGNDIRLARQPIFDAAQKTFAYELLFRNSAENRAVIDNAEYATADVIVRSLMEIGLDPMIGSALAFINVTRDFIVAGHCRWLPKERVVLEIVEGTAPDKELLAELKSLRAAGYRFALDNYVSEPQAEPLVELAEFIKVDLSSVDKALLEAKVPQLLKFKRLLVAEKVETQEEFEFCAQRGFHYFQGFFFCRPEMMAASAIPLNRVAVFRLLGKLHDPDVGARDIEKLVGEDLALSYKLLRYVNSAYVGLPHKIESIGHAVRLIGIEHVRLIASLIALSSIADEPRERIRISLIRARMCELMASTMGGSKETLFTVGLFSTIDAFLNRPMEQALELLPFTEEIRRALLSRDGVAGKTLEFAVMYENANLDELPEQFDARLLQDSYWQAVEWQQQVMARVN